MALRKLFTPEQIAKIDARIEQKQIERGYCVVELPMRAWKFNDSMEFWDTLPAERKFPENSETLIKYSIEASADGKGKYLFTVVENASIGYESFYLHDLASMELIENWNYYPLCTGSVNYQVLLVNRAELREICRAALESLLIEGAVTREQIESWGLVIYE